MECNNSFYYKDYFVNLETPGKNWNGKTTIPNRKNQLHYFCAPSAVTTHLQLVHLADLCIGGNMDSPDVSLADEDAGVVDALGESHLEDLSLEASLQEVLH